MDRKRNEINEQNDASMQQDVALKTFSGYKIEETQQNISKGNITSEYINDSGGKSLKSYKGNDIMNIFEEENEIFDIEDLFSKTEYEIESAEFDEELNLPRNTTFDNDNNDLKNQSKIPSDGNCKLIYEEHLPNDEKIFEEKSNLIIIENGNEYIKNQFPWEEEGVDELQFDDQIFADKNKLDDINNIFIENDYTSNKKIDPLMSKKIIDAKESKNLFGTFQDDDSAMDTVEENKEEWDFLSDKNDSLSYDKSKITSFVGHKEPRKDLIYETDDNARKKPKLMTRKDGKNRKSLDTESKPNGKELKYKELVNAKTRFNEPAISKHKKRSDLEMSKKDSSSNKKVKIAEISKKSEIDIEEFACELEDELNENILPDKNVAALETNEIDIMDELDEIIDEELSEDISSKKKKDLIKKNKPPNKSESPKFTQEEKLKNAEEIEELIKSKNMNNRTNTAMQFLGASDIFAKFANEENKDVLSILGYNEGDEADQNLVENTPQDIQKISSEISNSHIRDEQNKNNPADVNYNFSQLKNNNFVNIQSNFMPNEYNDRMNNQIFKKVENVNAINVNHNMPYNNQPFNNPHFQNRQYTNNEYNVRQNNIYNSNEPPIFNKIETVNSNYQAKSLIYDNNKIEKPMQDQMNLSKSQSHANKTDFSHNNQILQQNGLVNINNRVHDNSIDNSRFSHPAQMQNQTQNYIRNQNQIRNQSQIRNQIDYVKNHLNSPINSQNNTLNNFYKVRNNFNRAISKQHLGINFRDNTDHDHSTGFPLSETRNISTPRSSTNNLLKQPFNHKNMNYERKNSKTRQNEDDQDEQRNQNQEGAYASFNPSYFANGQQPRRNVPPQQNLTQFTSHNNLSSFQNPNFVPLQNGFYNIDERGLSSGNKNIQQTRNIHDDNVSRNTNGLQRITNANAMNLPNNVNGVNLANNANNQGNDKNARYGYEKNEDLQNLSFGRKGFNRSNKANNENSLFNPNLSSNNPSHYNNVHLNQGGINSMMSRNVHEDSRNRSSSTIPNRNAYQSNLGPRNSITDSTQGRLFNPNAFENGNFNNSYMNEYQNQNSLNKKNKATNLSGREVQFNTQRDNRRNSGDLMANPPFENGNNYNMTPREKKLFDEQRNNGYNNAGLFPQRNNEPSKQNAAFDRSMYEFKKIDPYSQRTNLNVQKMNQGPERANNIGKGNNFGNLYANRGNLMSNFEYQQNNTGMESQMKNNIESHIMNASHVESVRTSSMINIDSTRKNTEMGKIIVDNQNNSFYKNTNENENNSFYKNTNENENIFESKMLNTKTGVGYNENEQKEINENNFNGLDYEQNLHEMSRKNSEQAKMNFDDPKSNSINQSNSINESLNDTSLIGVINNKISENVCINPMSNLFTKNDEDPNYQKNEMGDHRSFVQSANQNNIEDEINHTFIADKDIVKEINVDNIIEQEKEEDSMENEEEIMKINVDNIIEQEKEAKKKTSFNLNDNRAHENVINDTIFMERVTSNNLFDKKEIKNYNFRKMDSPYFGTKQGAEKQRDNLCKNSEIVVPSRELLQFLDDMDYKIIDLTEDEVGLLLKNLISGEETLNKYDDMVKKYFSKSKEIYLNKHMKNKRELIGRQREEMVNKIYFVKPEEVEQCMNDLGAYAIFMDNPGYFKKNWRLFSKLDNTGLVTAINTIGEKFEDKKRRDSELYMYLFDEPQSESSEDQEILDDEFIDFDDL